MHTPLQAMIWELWRTSRAEMLLRMGLTLGMVLLLGVVAFTKPLGESETQVVCGVVAMVIAMTSVASSTWLLQFDKQQMGFSFRLGFVRPVSTTRLVVLPMIFTMLMSVVSYVIPAWVFGVVRNLPMPIIGPTPMIACVVACMIAAAWSPTTILFKVIAVGVLAMGTLLTLLAYHSQRGDADPILTAIGKLDFYRFSWTQYVTLFAITLSAFIVTIVCVDRQRHGDSLTIARPGRKPWKARPQSLLQPFANRFSAQFWYELRRFGTTVLLLGAIAPILVLILVVAGARIYPQANGIPGLWIGAVCMCPFVYQIVGADGAIGLRRRQGSVKLSAFDATRPMRNDQLIAIKLVVIAACSLVGWLCMALVAALYTLASNDWPAWVQSGKNISQFVGEIPSHWWIAALPNAALLYISSSSILLAFGLWLTLHPRIVLGVSIVAYAHMGLAVWDMRHNWVLRPLWIAYAYLIAAAILGGTIFALQKAIATGSLGIRLFFASLVLWAAYVTSTVAVSLKIVPVEIPRAALVLGASLLLVPLAATALAPLALASHRNQ